jgi:hypothetical protein
MNEMLLIASGSIAARSLFDNYLTVFAAHPEISPGEQILEVLQKVP